MVGNDLYRRKKIEQLTCFREEGFVADWQEPGWLGVDDVIII